VLSGLVGGALGAIGDVRDQGLGDADTEVTP